MPASQSNLCKRIFAVAISLVAALHAQDPQTASPKLADVFAARRDLWGELAMQQPNGASYEFFERLLPPPRYVHADFRYYPLVLSAPAAKVKARLISNGSGVNLRGGSRSWKDVGTPVVFRVGPDEFRFGELRDRLSDPQLAEGWLPIYEITYRHPAPVQTEGAVPVNQKPATRDQEVYRLEAFVSTDPTLAEYAVVFAQFSLVAGSTGTVTVHVDPPGGSRFESGRVINGDGKSVIWADPSWKWERLGLHASFPAGKSVTLAIATQPLDDAGFAFDEASYDRHRAITVQTWKEIVGRAMQVAVPEPRVNQAWRNLVVQNFMLLNGDRMLYSAGNQYEALYEAEGSDAVLAMLSWGYEDEAKRMFVPLLDFLRKGLEHHQAGLKLHDLVRCWWQTRDQQWLTAMRPRWETELDRLLNHRTEPDGLLPKERYCGDISTPVHSLSVESKAWRALRDLPPVLRAIGDKELATRVSRAEGELKPRLLDVVRRSLRRETTPPFIPNALLADEYLHDPITATRIGSYWNLVINFTIGSRIFPAGSEEELWIPRYLESHGGLCMGMVRAGGSAHGFWTGAERINPLYGTRYVVDTLRRDDPERALVSFYGMLAQGFTRNTLVAGEGCTLTPVDDGGRFFYCPPNSAGNSHLLTMLRNLLVQDFDLDDDGEPETLRLMFGTSRRWLEDGQKISVERAPTAFGPVSVRMESQIKAGRVTATVALPARNQPQQTLLRARVPEGWRVIGATVGEKSLSVDDNGTVDLTAERGTVVVAFAVGR